MRALGVALFAVAGLLVVSCGGDGESSSDPATRSACDKRGINEQTRREGTCTDNGVRYTVVNRDSRLRIPELTARLVEVEKVKSIEGESRSVTANGTYVIVRLAITNRLRVPTDVREGQVLLTLKAYTYPAANRDEGNQALRDSFVNQRDAKIRPGETRTGAVVFDIPVAAVRSLGKPRSSVFVLPFSEAGQEKPGRVGEFRLYE